MPCLVAKCLWTWSRYPCAESLYLYVDWVICTVHDVYWQLLHQPSLQPSQEFLLLCDHFSGDAVPIIRMRPSGNSWYMFSLTRTGVGGREEFTAAIQRSKNMIVKYIFHYRQQALCAVSSEQCRWGGGSIVYGVNYICSWFPGGEIYDTADTLMTRETTLVSQTPSSHYPEFDHCVLPTSRRFVSDIWRRWKIFVSNMEQFLDPAYKYQFSTEYVKSFF